MCHWYIKHTVTQLSHYVIGSYMYRTKHMQSHRVIAAHGTWLHLIPAQSNPMLLPITIAVAHDSYTHHSSHPMAVRGSSIWSTAPQPFPRKLGRRYNCINSPATQGDTHMKLESPLRGTYATETVGFPSPRPDHRATVFSQSGGENTPGNNTTWIYELALSVASHTWSLEVFCRPHLSRTD